MEHRFQVNLKGIIALLSDNLYSGPGVYVRELLQNGVDAIHARRLVEPAFTGGSIEIEINTGNVPTVVFRDDGVGLTEDDVHAVLATIGASSKRDELGKARTGFIGQFGIGLLSCFMVAEEIVVITRSVRPGAVPVEWRGRQDGTYAVRQLTTEVAAGTRVYLRSRDQMQKWCTAERVAELAKFYGALLPVPIELKTARQTVRINDEPPPWRQKYPSLEATRRAMLDYGQRLFNVDFFDVIPLQSTAGDVQGLAFVLPYSPSPAAKSQHRVYLKNMLLSENAEGILPDWAFFVRCIVNADSLRPNASREAFYEDDALEAARDQLGECLRSYLLRLATEDPQRLSRLVLLHQLAIKALAVHDQEFCRIFLDWIPFETSSGVMSMGEYRRENKVIRYAATVDQFRQVARVAASQQMCVINAGYTYSEQLLRQIPEIHPETSVEEIDAGALSRSFDELTMAEREKCFGLTRAADAVLMPFRCASEVVKFQPAELATLYNTSRDASLFRSAEQASEISDSHWSGILGNVVGNQGSAYARMFLNYNNPMIRRLSEVKDAPLLKRCVEMLYVQSLLLGMHPLSSRELNLLNTGLLGLVDAALDGKEAT